MASLKQPVSMIAPSTAVRGITNGAVRTNHATSETAWEIPSPDPNRCPKWQERRFMSGPYNIQTPHTPTTVESTISIQSED